MARRDVETVLANWIEQALSPIGRLPEGLSPSAWVAAQFAEWWRKEAEDALGEAERAATAAFRESERLGGWESCGELRHELTHLREALADLRDLMGLSNEAKD